MRATTIFAAAILPSITAAGDAQSEQKPDTVCAFHFGNSLTGGAMPGFHEQLAKSAGKYGPDVHHDWGALLPIRPERTKIVNDTVWQVVTTDPHTKGPTSDVLAK